MKDKVAYITGGTKGIGFGIAQVLLKNGIHVAVSGRKREDAEEAARLLSEDESKVFGIASDVKNF
ncbi:MAG: SDR family NAD(P)-dependent oxidoreductase, partial [Kaistella sp.]